jgi:hypothetical protein
MRMMRVSRDVERKAVKFAAGLVIVVALFCVWLARAVTKDKCES